MTLAIVFKGTEGIVLAADSRVTLTFQVPGTQLVTPAHFDNATKVLKVGKQKYAAAVTFGLGTFGQLEPRTAHSYLPEFEQELINENVERLSVQEFAERLSGFYLKQFQASNTPANAGDMSFLVGGYDERAAYGRMFQVSIPSNPNPVEHNANVFGLRFGGQHEITSRILNGFDGNLLGWLKARYNLDDVQTAQLSNDAMANHLLSIPYQVLPLQDCVDLCILLVETTAQLMAYTVGVRGVGGAVDVATITRMDGYQPIQVKRVKGRDHEVRDGRSL
jgi:hypothetical protein